MQRSPAHLQGPDERGESPSRLNLYENFYWSVLLDSSESLLALVGLRSSGDLSQRKPLCFRVALGPTRCIQKLSCMTWLALEFGRQALKAAESTETQLPKLV